MRLLIRRGLGAYARDTRGASAAEFALWLVFMIWPVLNVVDLGFYVFQTMQVRTAAQMATQAAQTICGEAGKTPVASQCMTPSTLWTALGDAAQTSRLGTAVSIGASSATNGYEGWYCTNASGAQTLAPGTAVWAINGGTPSPATAPTTCTNGETAYDYVAITGTYTFKPLFSGVDLLSLFLSSSTISQTAWMRVN